MDKHNRVEDIQKPTHKDKPFKDTTAANIIGNTAAHRGATLDNTPVKDNAATHKRAASEHAPFMDSASANTKAASEHAPLEDNASAHKRAASEHAPFTEKAASNTKIAVNNVSTLNKRKIGAWAEQQACEYLTSNGYKIIKQNFRVSRFGEIDIIAYDAEYICFIEVKARSTCSFGLPREAVTYEKQQKIKMLANIYLSQNRCKNYCVRFDVIEIYYNSLHEIQNLQLLKNAF